MDRREFLWRAGGVTAAAMAGGGWPTWLAAQTMPTTRQALDGGALSGHRVSKIESRQLQDVFPRSVGPNSRGNPAGTGAGFEVRVLTTDQGVSGWAMAGGSKDADAQKYIGSRLSDLFDVRQGKAPDVVWWMDKLLYDVAGRVLGQPVWRMLGVKGARGTLVYDGAIYMEDVWPKDKPRGIEAVLAACEQDYRSGYRAFKLKVGRGKKWMDRREGLKRDIELTRAVREKYKQCELLVDANDAWTVQEAIEFVQQVADCDLYWIEEPFEENEDDLKKLKEAMAKAGCRARIADGESRKERAAEPSRFGGYTEAFGRRILELGRAKLLDVTVMDLDIVGFSRWRKLMDEFKDAGLAASPHLWMWTGRTYYAAQLAAGVGNIEIIEGIPGAARGMDTSAFAMKDGKLVVPETAGFGMELRQASR